MFPMDRKAKRLVAVWYDSHGRRRFKVFDDPYAARRFYAAKTRAGRNPKVGKVPPDHSIEE
jgi:hypothetical protein